MAPFALQRRGRDSNPRESFPPPTRLAGECLQPLGHLSGRNQDCMRRNAIVTVAVVIALVALGSQIAIPAYVSSQVEDRLTQNGGTAHVEVHSFPAAELIGGKGDRIEIHASDLKLDLPAQSTEVFGRLDKFEEVEAELVRVNTGPFRVDRFVLKRGKGERTYRLSMQAS